jgi:serine protease AprX
VDVKPIWRRLSVAIVFLAALAATGDVQGTIAAASRRAQDRQKLDINLRAALDAGRRESQRVIIRTRAGETAEIRRTLSAHGDQVVADHESIDALTAVVHADDLDALAARDGVISVSTDAIVEAKLLTGLIGGLLRTVGGLVEVVGSVLLPNGADTQGPAVPPAVLRDTLGLKNTWSGRGIGVAVIDSGLEMSSEFTGRVTAFYDFTRGGVVATSPFDDYGHGTHVAGTIGGSGALSSSREYRGLAPRVDFVILKVLDKDGAGWTSDVIRAVDFAVANKTRLGIDVINLSLGHPIYEPASTDPLVQAVERAVRAGVIVVAAAGNFGKNPTTGLPGYAGITSPGNAPSALTVGALRTEDTVSRSDDWIPDYSSRGPTWYDGLVKPDVVAPGHNIVAAAAKRGTLYKTYPQLKAADADYMRLSGTSMATAVTTGVVALMLEANREANDFPRHPSITPNAVKAILQYSAFNVRNQRGIEYDPLTQGGGAINGAGAIDLALAVDTSAEQGTPWLRTIPAPWTTIGGEDLTWQQTVVWGNTVVWGATVGTRETAWGTTVVWGANTTWGSTVVWGANLVWTDPQSWGQTVVWGADTIGTVNGDTVVWGAAGSSAQSTAWGNLANSQSNGMYAGGVIR